MWSADAGAGVKSCMNLAHGGRWEGQVKNVSLRPKLASGQPKECILILAPCIAPENIVVRIFAKTSFPAKPTVVNFHHTLLQQASEGSAWKCHTVLRASRPQNEITSANSSCSPWRRTIEQY